MFRKKAILITIIAIILFAYFFFLLFPLVLVGPPGPLYYIQNEDVIPHNITVEIFDAEHESVFKKSYVLDANEHVKLNREILWYFPFPSTFITWHDGVYTFNFTVDSNISNQITRDINQYESISVDLYDVDHFTSEIKPIRIRIMTV